MRIVIEYDSCWQTGFLSDDLNRPIDYSKRSKSNFHADNGFVQKFVATSSSRGEKSTPISDNTILGILCRLIGDQRKLFQARQSNNYYFADIENKITWQLKNNFTSNELAYITNKSDSRCGQGTWLGIISDDNPWFYSELSPLLWSVLYLDRDQILEFIKSDEIYQPIMLKNIDCRPTALLGRLHLIVDIKSKLGKPWLSLEQSDIARSKLEEKCQLLLDKRNKSLEKFERKLVKTRKDIIEYEEKSVDFEEKIADIRNELLVLDCDSNFEKLNRVTSKLKEKYPDCDFWSEGKVFPQRIYVSALYEQAFRMQEKGFDIPFVLDEKGDGKVSIKIKGFSAASKANRGFNGARDWLNSMAGSRKKAVGTPCGIQKQTGQVEINLEIDRDRAIRLKEMIDYAGVSSFYLGKKGLAYVSDICL